MKATLDQVTQYWSQLRRREQMLLASAGVVIGLLLIYLLVWEPQRERSDELKQLVKQQQALHAWMVNAAAEAKALQGQASSGGKISAGQSLLGVIDQTAKRGGLGSAVKRVEPDGSTRARVWLEAAKFDDVLRWLHTVQKRYSITVDSAIIDRGPSPGLVTARLVFSGGES